MTAFYIFVYNNYIIIFTEIVLIMFCLLSCRFRLTLSDGIFLVFSLKMIFFKLFTEQLFSDYC